MTNELREKLAKVYELVNNGATEGERIAAKKALDRMIDKYNINQSELDSLNLKKYIFKYSTKLEYKLLAVIMNMFIADGISTSRRMNFDGEKSVKQIVSNLTYMDWITVESAYEYFRRHMKSEWQRLCMPEINRCRKAKTKKERREALEPVFFGQYIIASKLCKPSEIISVPNSELSKQELQNMAKVRGIEGGNYKRQLTSGLLLEN